MRRIPEPELMDEPEQARAYSEADFSEPHDCFVALMRERLPEVDGGTALDLGCGPADVTARVARAYPGLAILGVDAGPNMLGLAAERIGRLGLENRVRFELRHLPDDTLDGQYDLVFSNSLLHHLDDPAALWQTVRRLSHVRCVFVMDLLRPASERALADIVKEHAASAPEVLRRDFENSLRAAYRPEEIVRQLNDAGLDRLAVEPVGDRHWIAWGTLDG